MIFEIEDEVILFKNEIDKIVTHIYEEYSNHSRRLEDIMNEYGNNSIYFKMFYNMVKTKGEDSPTYNLDVVQVILNN